MIESKATSRVFQEGDEVVLVGGGYTGTPGVFLHLREDPKWADITERDGSVRRHPVEWLLHSTQTTERTAS
jgi:hypothetical protein